MKHSTISTLKFKNLSRALGLPLCWTVGVLESVWLFAQMNAKDGDLTKFSPNDLAAWIEFPGDSQALWDALMSTKWLDTTADGRVVIHDWLDHCPKWVKGWLNSQIKREAIAPPYSPQANSPTANSPQAIAPGQRGGGYLTQPNLTQPNPTKKESARFSPPTVAEVREYVESIGGGVDPEHFCDHYTANGWKVGAKSMKDWRAAVRNWRRRAGDFSGVNSSGKRPKNLCDFVNGSSNGVRRTEEYPTGLHRMPQDERKKGGVCPESC